MVVKKQHVVSSKHRTASARNLSKMRGSSTQLTSLHKESSGDSLKPKIRSSDSLQRLNRPNLSMTKAGPGHKREDSAGSDRRSDSDGGHAKENTETRKKKESEKPPHLRQGGKVVIGLAVSDEDDEDEDGDDYEDDDKSDDTNDNGLVNGVNRLAIGTEINDQVQADANASNGVDAHTKSGEVADTESQSMTEDEPAVVTMQEKMGSEPGNQNGHAVNNHGGHVEHHEHAYSETPKATKSSAIDPPISPKSVVPAITSPTPPSPQLVGDGRVSFNGDKNAGKRLGRSVEVEEAHDMDSDDPENVTEVYDESEFPDSPELKNVSDSANPSRVNSRNPSRNVSRNPSFEGLGLLKSFGNLGRMTSASRNSSFDSLRLSQQATEKAPTLELSSHHVISNPDGSSGHTLGSNTVVPSDSPRKTPNSTPRKEQQSRTQQKLWLQRENAIDEHDSPRLIAAEASDNQTNVKAEHLAIDKQYKSVRTFYNPILEGLQRHEICRWYENGKVVNPKRREVQQRQLQKDLQGPVEDVSDILATLFKGVKSESQGLANQAQRAALAMKGD